jgi:hypothetical protein
MAKKSEGKKAKAEAAPKAEANPVQKAGKAIRAGAEKAMANSAAINARVIDQAEANAKEAFAAMRAAAGARSVNDVVKIQTKFVKEQGARSVEQVREIGDMIARFGRDAIEQLRGK